MTAVADASRLEMRLVELAGRAIPTPSPHLGVDAVDVDAFARKLDAGGPRLAGRWFTRAEISFAAGDGERLAATFAGKEAVAKVLGTGIRGGVRWRHIEIPRRPDGAPFVLLFEAARRRADVLAIDHVAISLCHEPPMAIAVASAVPAQGSR